MLRLPDSHRDTTSVLVATAATAIRAVVSGKAAQVVEASSAVAAALVATWATPVLSNLTTSSTHHPRVAARLRLLAPVERTVTPLELLPLEEPRTVLVAAAARIRPPFQEPFTRSAQAEAAAVPTALAAELVARAVAALTLLVAAAVAHTPVAAPAVGEEPTLVSLPLKNQALPATLQSERQLLQPATISTTRTHA